MSAIVVLLAGWQSGNAAVSKAVAPLRCPGFESLSRRRSCYVVCARKRPAGRSCGACFRRGLLVAGLRVSLAVVFKRGDVARVFVMFDNNSHGEGRTALVDAALARMRLANEIAYLVTVDDVLGFLEASARPVPAGRVVFYPATVGGAGDVFEGFVDGEHYLRGPFLRGRAYSRLPVVLYHVHVSFADAGVGFNLLCGKYRRY